MKRITVFLLITCIICSVSGCTNSGRAQKVFEVKGYNLQMTADRTFTDSTGGDFDLQITNEYSYIGIMVFNYSDLPKGLTQMDIYDWQNDDFLSRRSNRKNIEKASTDTYPNYSITQSLYSAKKDGVENYYASYLIDFPSNEVFAWVLVSTTPSYFNSNREYLHNIVCTIQVPK